VTRQSLPAPAIRDERPDDHAAIHGLTQRAFAPMPFAAGDEQDLIDALREAGGLSLSLVAILDGKLVGHIAFSLATTEDGRPGWYALDPVSVEPGLQKSGIGSALINAGIQRLGAAGASGFILTGNPAYYTRFGFRPRPDLCPPQDPAEYFMVLALGDEAPSSRFAFHPLFHAG